MNDKINGRTPEEIKQAIEICNLDNCPESCAKCPYDWCEYEYKCINILLADALAYIQQLEDHFREATKKVQQLERERDAAVDDMTELIKLARYCRHCKYITANGECTCDQPTPAWSEPWCWEWRGVQEVE